jgi:hypothetical protein
MVGIYEFQLKNLDKEFCQMFEEYLPYFGISWASVKTKQLRVIPVDSAVQTISLVEKPKMEPPPEDFPATLRKIATERLAIQH